MRERSVPRPANVMIRQEVAEPQTHPSRATKGLRVLVSVLTFNSPESTIETLHTLQQQTYRDYHLMLVDNASDERLLERVVREFPDLDVRRTAENSGYTGGNNFALRVAREEGYDCLLIATHDVQVEPRTLENLVETAMSHPDAGIVGAVELDSLTGHERASDGGAFSVWFSRLSWKTAPRAGSGPRDVFCVHGALLLFTDKLISNGLRMDENLFMYFDEVDLGFRLRERGLRLFVDRRVVFSHRGAAERFTPRVGYLMQRNRLYIVRKHGRWFHLLFYVLYSSLLELPAKALVRTLQGRGRFAYACLAGHIDALRESPSVRYFN